MLKTIKYIVHQFTNTLFCAWFIIVDYFSIFFVIVGYNIFIVSYYLNFFLQVSFVAQTFHHSAAIWRQLLYFVFVCCVLTHHCVWLVEQISFLWAIPSRYWDRLQDFGSLFFNLGSEDVPAVDAASSVVAAFSLSISAVLSAGAYDTWFLEQLLCHWNLNSATLWQSSLWVSLLILVLVPSSWDSSDSILFLLFLLYLAMF